MQTDEELRAEGLARMNAARAVAVREPPIVGNADPATSHLAAKLIQPKRGSKRAAVLELLQQGGWVTADRIREVGGSEGLRRLRELSAMGHRIERRPHEGNLWAYRYMEVAS